MKRAFSSQENNMTVLTDPSRRVYRSRNLNKRLEYTFMAFVHVVVATGVAMVGTGASGLAGKNPEASDQTNLEVGMALLEACWATLTVWALWTLKDCSEKTVLGVMEGNMVHFNLTQEILQVSVPSSVLMP